MQSVKQTILRYVTYWLYVLLCLGVPIGLLAWQFDLFKTPGVMQLTAYGIITVIVAVFILRGQLRKLVDDMEKGVPRTIVQNLLKLAPFIIFWLILLFLEDHIMKVRTILFWSLIGYLAAAFVDVWHTKIVMDMQSKN